MTSIDGQLNWVREPGFVASRRSHQSRERDAALVAIDRLRAFSLLLCLDAKLANQLVETTLLRVCVSTNLSHLNPRDLAWLIGRLRSYYYAEFANRRATIDQQSALPGGTSRQHSDVLAALSGLTAEQREALILI